MPALLAAAVAVGVAGVLGIIALATVRQLNDTPAEMPPFDDIDYLWWDEGVHWAAR